MSSFTKIPTIDYQDLRHPSTRAEALKQLRYALIHVGFFYLENPPVSPEQIKLVEEQAYAFFNLPEEEKLVCEMTRLRHFLGYSRLAQEVTAKSTDWREQVDFGTELEGPDEAEVRTEDDLYLNLVGPNIWPNEALLPNYRSTIESYFNRMIQFNYEFLSDITSLIGLPEGLFNKYFNQDLKKQCHKMKLIYYPDLEQLAQNNEITPLVENEKPLGQGVGPHRDGGFITFIHQATHHNSLQVLSYDNKWIDVPPKDRSYVVAVGQTLEFITEGVIKATIHQVLTPKPGEGSRLSIPFFVGMENKNYKTTLGDIPKDLIEERDSRKDTQQDIGFQFVPDLSHPVGYANFANRVKSHPNVAKIWYPDYTKKILQLIA